MDTMLPYALTALSLAFAVYSWARNRNDAKDSKQDSVRMELAKLSVKVDTVADSTEEMKSDIKTFNATNLNMERRLAAVEMSVAQAHKRISELRKESDG